MPYAAQATLSMDTFFRNRVAACAAVEVPHPADPVQWAVDHTWRLAASPGFAEAYEYAQNNGVENPGNDPAVITDGQILAAVQAVVAEEETP